MRGLQARGRASGKGGLFLSGALSYLCQAPAWIRRCGSSRTPSRTIPASLPSASSASPQGPSEDDASRHPPTPTRLYTEPPSRPNLQRALRGATKKGGTGHKRSAAYQKPPRRIHSNGHTLRGPSPRPRDTLRIPRNTHTDPDTIQPYHISPPSHTRPPYHHHSYHSSTPPP